MIKPQNNQYVKKQVVSEGDVVKYLIERFNNVKTAGNINFLVDFHSSNKFMIMAHDQEELKKLGDIVAKYKKIPFSKILKNYEIGLRRSLEKPLTIKKHSNVILHIFGFFSKNFNQHEKQVFFELFEKYKNEIISLGKFLSEIHPLIFKFNKTYLASQTYFLLYADKCEGIIFESLLNEKNKNKFKNFVK